MCNLVWECVSSAGLIFIYTWMHEVDLNVKVIYRTNVKQFSFYLGQVVYFDCKTYLGHFV